MSQKRVISTRGWSIDCHANHCSHTSGLHAYFDPDPTSSGALRCIGPFSNPGTRLIEASVKRYMHDLSAALESLPENSGFYTLWGAFQNKPEHSEHRVVLMGQAAGFIPNPTMRTELASSEGSTLNLSREWHVNVNQDTATHRNGLRFERIPGPAHSTFLGFLNRKTKVRVCASAPSADPATMHPALEAEMVEILAEHVVKLLGHPPGLLHRVDVLTVSPLFQWQDMSYAQAS